MILSENVKKNPNDPQYILVDVKNNIKLMAMEQSVYAQIINFCHDNLLFDTANKNKTESKFKFQGQSTRSQLWFDLDLDWIDINFSTREPDFYKKLLQSHDNKQYKDTFKTFKVPIGNEKVVKSFMYQKDAPIIRYCQKKLNSCCFSSLASDFASIKQFKDENAISIRIKESLESEVGNHIHFANEIMLNNRRNKGEARVHYQLIKYRLMGEYKISEDISANVTLVKLMN